MGPDDSSPATPGTQRRNAPSAFFPDRIESGRRPPPLAGSGIAAREDAGQARCKKSQLQAPSSRNDRYGFDDCEILAWPWRLNSIPLVKTVSWFSVLGSRLDWDRLGRTSTCHLRTRTHRIRGH